MLVPWLIRLAQFIVNLIFPPPVASDCTTSVVTCYDVLYWCRPPINWGVNNPALYLRKFAHTRPDVEQWLNREDIHLFCVTDTSFVFARTTPGVDIHNVSEFPFLYRAKQAHTIELGEIPIGLALDLAENRPDTGSNIGFIHNMGRCGSTLVAHMMHKTGLCQVLAEPGALLDISGRVVKERALAEDPSTVKKLRAVLLFLAKSPNTKYFIKPHFVILGILPLIQKSLPGCREAFLFRALKPMAFSSKVAFQLDMPFPVLKRICVMAAFFSQHDLKKMEGDGVDSVWKMILYVFLQRAYNVIQEIKARSGTADDFPFYSYESLLANPEDFVTHLLAHFGLGSQGVELALTAMREDSQRNSELSQKKLQRKMKAKIELDSTVVEFTRLIAAEKFAITLEGNELEMKNLPNQWCPVPGQVSNQ